jgi:hypothetical protein
MQMWVQPCPRCRQQSAQQVRRSWWGGGLGPRLLNHVRCDYCGEEYNGKTGGSNKTAIVIYVVVSTFFGVVAGLLIASGRLFR